MIVGKTERVLGNDKGKGKRGNPKEVKPCWVPEDKQGRYK